MSAIPRIPPALWPEVSALFDEATTLPPAGRAAWLRGVEGQRPELAPHLQRLLAAHDSVATLEPPSGELLNAALGAQVQTLAAGQMVGLYRLLEPLGQGGMASVWQAEQTQGVLRRVALKLPLAGLEAPAATARRFEQERDLLAGLEHPHIARLYDAGITPEGQPFLAMELVHGRPITEAAAALPLRARLQLFLQVLAAVSFAHGRLVIHRDLKPGNILVTGDGQARLLDFGIARLLGEGEGAPLQAGRAFTPECAPPEQLAGAPLGAAADVYALGVVLYELLTGQRPYTLDRASAVPLAEQLQARVVQPPSVAAPGQRRALAGDLDAIVARAMALQADARYPSAEALAADIRRHLQGLPVEARGSGRAYVAGRFLRRHRLAGAAGAVALSALGLGLGVALWQAGEARQQAARAQASRDYLMSLFRANALDQDDALRKRQQTVQQLLESSARRLDDQLSGQPELLADMQGVVGGLLHELSLSEGALALRERRARALAGSGAPAALQARARLDQAETLLQLGRPADAEAALQTALASLGTPRDAAARALRSAALTAQGQAHVVLGRTAQAGPVLEEAVALARQPPVDATVLAGALSQLARLRSVQAKPDESVALFREAIAAWGAAGSGSTLGQALAHEQLGEELGAQRRYVEAVDETRKAVQLLRERAGPEQVQTALMEMNLGRMVSVQGRPLDGRPLLQHASQVLLAAGEDVSPQRRVDALVFLGESMLDAGEIAAAGVPLQQAVALDAARTPRADALPLLVLSRQLLDTGRYDEAVATLQRARERRVLQLGAEHPAVAAVDNRIALVWMAQGRFDDAERGFRAILDVADARGGPFGSMRDLARHNLDTLALERGRFEGALEPAQAALARLESRPAAERNRSYEQSLNGRLARVLDGLGRPAEARPYFERALALAEGDQHPDSPRLAIARARLATCLAAVGERSAASVLLAQAEATAAAQPEWAPHLRAVIEKARRSVSARG